MTTPTPTPPLRVLDAPDPVDRELAPLLDEPFASALAVPAPTAPVRQRLLQHVAASRQASRPMVTVRARRLQPQAPTAGVQLRLLYEADTTRPPRPGEPLRAWLVDLAPGAAWSGPATDTHREWLLLRGQVRLGGETLSERDYHVDPLDSAALPIASDAGALLFLRESALPAQPGDRPHTVHDQLAGWPDYAPGIRRRVLWQRGGQAALLYHAAPGAQVPHHRHGHDEECLMVQGELFLDDVLLQAGDYQLAPAGTGHQRTETDTGVVIYAHGDLDLQFVA